jgi:ATP-dependent RNA helicase RhlE
LDEEGFMKDIEHFTKQQVPVVVVEGFGPEADEKAEPIAMGRQTLWGGLGKPPGRDVMAAAAKAARSEMMQRIRDTKGASGAGGRGGRAPAPRGEGGDSEGRAPRPNGHVSRDRNGDRPVRDGNRPQGQGPRPARQFDNRGPRQDAPRPPRDFEPRMPRDNEARPPRRDDDDFQPRANAHLGTQSGVNAFGHKTQGGGQRQPDPTRTSVDLMTERKRGGGGFGGGGGGRRNGGGGGGGGRSGGGGGRSGGGYGGGGGYGR